MASILNGYKDISFHGLKIGKLIFYGIPRSGKTTLCKQLVRSIDNRLEYCGTPEPSTNIGDIYDPILIEQEQVLNTELILAKNEEGNEWRWTIQGLDDLAKTLLQSIDIEPCRRNEEKQQAKMLIEETAKLHRPQDSSSVTTKVQFRNKSESVTVTKTFSSAEPSERATSEGENSQVTSSTVAADEESNPEIDLKGLFFRCY